MNRTLIVIKPHAVERGLVGKILTRFEQMGLKIVALKVIQGTAEFWSRFYPSNILWYKSAGSKTLANYQQYGMDVFEQLGTNSPIEIGKMVKEWLVHHMSSGDAIAVILEGNEAPYKVRAACGNTLPNMAAPGTIRFDFSIDSPRLANIEKRPVYNLIHAADPDEIREGRSAIDYEIGMIFPQLEE